jgi:hypothetical protein
MAQARRVLSAEQVTGPCREPAPSPMSDTVATETSFVPCLRRAVQPPLVPQLSEHELALYLTAVGPLGESLPKGLDRAFLPSRFEHRSSFVVAPPLIRPFWSHTRAGSFYAGLFHHDRLYGLRSEPCGCRHARSPRSPATSPTPRAPRLRGLGPCPASLGCMLRDRHAA